MDEEVIETLYQNRCVHLYKIPPRPAAGGHRSGEWLVADRIFSGRARVVARGEVAEVRLEEGSGELFAMCPVEFGKRAAAVEPVVDSSRYFVLRVVDPESGRHAFLGLGFDDRGDAFDFTAALSDHERRLQRERDTAAAAGAGRAGAASPVGGAAAALYQDRGHLSLRPGQTIRIELKKSGSRPSSGGSGGGASGGGGGGGFLQRAPSVPLAPLAPPPVGALGPLPVLAPPPPPASSSAPGDSALQGPAARAAAPPKARSGNPFDSEDGEDAGPPGGDGAGSGGGTLRVSRAGGGGADDGQGAGSQEAPGGQRQEGEGWAAF